MEEPRESSDPRALTATEPFASDNRPRYTPGTDHVESWFFRANHPTEPKALWLKATLLGRRRGPSVAEVWCSLFDGGPPRARGAKVTVPVEEAEFSGSPLGIEIAESRFRLEADGGSARGAAGGFTWDLRWRRPPGAPAPLTEPLCLLPFRRLIDAPLPKNKLLTPAPALQFSGTVTWDGETWEVDRWLGMQGHNWGAAHSPQYAWGQCNFTNAQGAPFASVEAASGRIVVAGQTTPLLALMTIRRGNQAYRFDRLLDLWNQKAKIDFPRWSLRMRGPDGEAALTMEARPERMVCLGYENPDGRLSHCLNSKLARVHLRVNPVNDDGFECTSDHGGALEFLQPDPPPQIAEVV